MHEFQDMKNPVKISPKQDKTEKIHGIIFSRDRAMQLEGVLRSLFLHCQDADQMDISVLYRTTDGRHDKQYQQLIAEYSGRVVFKNQTDFRRDLLSILNPYEEGGMTDWIFLRLVRLGGFGVSLGSFAERLWRRTLRPIQKFIINILLPKVPADKFVLFLVDDNIFIRDFCLMDVLDTLKEQREVLGFSLRLGQNTTYCYTQNRVQALPDFKELSGDIHKFAWVNSDGDFGYPLEISSSMYRSRDVLPLLTWINFENPNVLEARMAFHASAFQDKVPFLGCYRNSVTFCNPVNMVQNSMPNRMGFDIQYAANSLAFRFEQGERIRIESYDGFIPNGCHQEVELVFEKRE